MADFMVQINKKVCCGLVGGSDLEKITEQMGGKEALHKLDYVFAENGLAAYKKGETIAIMVYKTKYCLKLRMVWRNKEKL